MVDVVDVQVRVHDKIHFVGGRACTRELGEKPGPSTRHECTRLRPEPGVDEQRRADPANENSVDR